MEVENKSNYEERQLMVVVEVRPTDIHDEKMEGNGWQCSCKLALGTSWFSLVKCSRGKDNKGNLGCSHQIIWGQVTSQQYILEEETFLRMTESISITDHINNLNILFFQLSYLDYKIGENEHAELLLQSLLDSYDQLIINLTNNILIDYLSFDDMFVVILEEESRRKNKEDRLESSKQGNALLVRRDIDGAWF